MVSGIEHRDLERLSVSGGRSTSDTGSLETCPIRRRRLEGKNVTRVVDLRSPRANEFRCLRNHCHTLSGRPAQTALEVHTGNRGDGRVEGEIARAIACHRAQWHIAVRV